MRYTLYHEILHVDGFFGKRYALRWSPPQKEIEPVIEQKDMGKLLDKLRKYRKRRDKIGQTPILDDASFEAAEKAFNPSQWTINENYSNGSSLEDLATNLRANHNFHGISATDKIETLLPGITKIFTQIDVYEAHGLPVTDQEITQFEQLFQN